MFIPENGWHAERIKFYVESAIIAPLPRGPAGKGSPPARIYALLRPMIILAVHLITRLRARIVVETADYSVAWQARVGERHFCAVGRVWVYWLIRPAIEARR